MRQSPFSRRFLMAVMASASVLLTAQTTLAQGVRIFEEAPSIEQLRSIMIPESRGSQARSIVMQRPDAGMARPSPLQRTTAQIDAEAPVMAAPPALTPRMAAPETAPPVVRPIVQAPLPAKALPPAQAQDAVPDAGIVGFRINFAFDSADLPANAHLFIDRIAELLRQEPQVKLRVEGHTDALGAATYNLALSERRALAVAEYLVQHHGIAPERLVLQGKGMAEPVAADPYAPQNRRVQFVRVG